VLRGSSACVGKVKRLCCGGQAPVSERSSTYVAGVKRLCCEGQAPVLEGLSACVAGVKRLCRRGQAPMLQSISATKAAGIYYPTYPPPTFYNATTTLFRLKVFDFRPESIRGKGLKTHFNYRYRFFAEPVLRFFTSFRMTNEGLRMTPLLPPCPEIPRSSGSRDGIRGHPSGENARLCYYVGAADL
jgi:hypothetical protein